MNEPKLRFKEFSEEWVKFPLSEMTNRVRGNDGRTDLPVLTMSASLGWLNQKDRFSRIIAGTELKNYTLLKRGELSYNHGNSKLAKYGVVFELKNYEEALVPRVYHSFKTNNKSNSTYLEYYFSSKIPDRELGKLVTSGARMDGLLNINYDAFMGIKINFPKLEEQQKIGEFLGKLDKRIQVQQQKIDLLQEQNKGYMQKIFKQEIRFKDDDGGEYPKWKQTYMKECFDHFGGTALEKYTTEYGKYKFISIGSYNENNRYNDQGIRINLNDKTKTKLLSKDDLVMVLNDKTASGNIIGRVLLIEEDNKYIYNQRSERLVSSSEILSVYAWHFLNSDNFRRRIVSMAQGGTQIYVNYSSIKELKFDLPTLEEQQKIANFLSELDKKIQLEQQKLELIQEQKKGFMQQMFI
ncbi:restriction endonuclease subunit S [Priestia aryabhattai]|uniref:restriction endonuclease subunit S n=1 Tax=Priestia aryabhattai TaxID=412384 RepID=UPI003B66D224